MPYANQRNPDDPGVAAYFQQNGRPRVIACDRWVKVEGNIQAIRKTIEAMRGIERWGSSEMLDRLWDSYALPKGETHTSTAWWTRLGVSPDASREAIETAYRAQARTAHPDHGGSHEVMAALNDDVEQTRRAREEKH